MHIALVVLITKQKVSTNMKIQRTVQHDPYIDGFDAEQPEGATGNRGRRYRIPKGQERVFGVIVKGEEREKHHRAGDCICFDRKSLIAHM